MPLRLTSDCCIAMCHRHPTQTISENMVQLKPTPYGSQPKGTGFDLQCVQPYRYASSMLLNDMYLKAPYVALDKSVRKIIKY